MKTRREFLSSVVGGALISPALTSMTPALAGADDEKVAKQLAKLDTEFVKALSELAQKYDKDKVPEAAHFFASCAIGFGAKDEALSSLKASYEASVYLGRLRGGEPIKETGPISSALGNHSVAYKKILDPWIAKARKNDLPESSRKMMLETGVKYEIARGAHEYVQAVQRVNALRKAMGLRALLWDSEESQRLIYAAWYTTETGHYEYRASKRESLFYTAHVDSAVDASWGPNSLKEYPEVLRSYVLVRQDLLNPNARQLRLGHWKGGAELEQWGLYAIPQLPYREDIPTPSQRFRGQTVVKDWLDVEDYVEIKGRKIPYVRYPYPTEIEVPRVYSDGRGGIELGGWANSEHEFLNNAGVPIMLRLFGDATLSDVVCEIKRLNGAPQVSRVYLNGDKRLDFHREYPTILVIPEKRLDPLSQYVVTVRAKINESPFENSWNFTTGAK